jgi:hypothetical protein
VDEIVVRLRDREHVPGGDTRELAQGRLDAAGSALIENGGIETERLEWAEPEVSVKGPGRVELELAP